jgi:hypothetical protein
MNGSVTIPGWTALLLGLLLLPAIGAHVTFLILLRDIKRGNDELLRIHTREYADEAGFGTVALTHTMKRSQYALEQLVHYTKWMAEERTGKEPPPPPSPPGD